MRRWCSVLECSHNLLGDEEPTIGSHEYCPGCGMSYRVVDVYLTFDEEAALYAPPLAERIARGYELDLQAAYAEIAELRAIVDRTVAEVPGA